MPDQLRRPHRSFDCRNGFTEDLEPPTASARDLTVLNRHRVAQFVLSQLGTYFPSKQQLLDLKNLSEKPNDLRFVKEQIRRLQNKHLDDLERLYDFQAQEYLQEAEDRYLSKDDSQFLTKGENNLMARSSYAKLDVSLYKETRKQHTFSSEWDDTMDRLCVGYLNRLFPLHTKRVDLEIKEQVARRQRDARFPSSSGEYRTIRDKEIQLRIARFLMAHEGEQEEMMTLYGWAWRQVQPLKQEYNFSSSFRSEIQSRTMEVDAGNPRRK